MVRSTPLNPDAEPDPTEQGDLEAQDQQAPYETEPAYEAAYEPEGYEGYEPDGDEPPARRRRTLADVFRPGPVSVTLAILAFLVVGGAAAAVERNGGVTYGSTVVLAIDQPLVVAGSTDAGPIEKLNRLRLQYAALVKTAVVADEIANRTGRTAGDVANSLDVQPSQNSLLIILTARDADRARAKALATAAASALTDYTQRSQVSAGVPPKEQVVLTTVTPAGPAGRITRSHRTIATVGLALGLVAAAAVYVLVSLLGSLRRR